MPSSIISTINSIWKKMRRKPYRDAFIASHVSETVAAQIALLRSERGWTQKQLAEKTSMKQSRISALEDPNYENYEVGTLKRIASAFDVGLTVRFVPFSDVVRWSATLGPHKLTIADFENDCIDGRVEAWGAGGNKIEVETVGWELPPKTFSEAVASDDKVCAGMIVT